MDDDTPIIDDVVSMDETLTEEEIAKLMTETVDDPKCPYPITNEQKELIRKMVKKEDWNFVISHLDANAWEALQLYEASNKLLCATEEQLELFGHMTVYTPEVQRRRELKKQLRHKLGLLCASKRTTIEKRSRALCKKLRDQDAPNEGVVRQDCPQ